jgi:hypothetical protein
MRSKLLSPHNSVLFWTTHLIPFLENPNKFRWAMRAVPQWENKMNRHCCNDYCLLDSSSHLHRRNAGRICQESARQVTLLGTWFLKTVISPFKRGCSATKMFSIYVQGPGELTFVSFVSLKMTLLIPYQSYVRYVRPYAGRHRDLAKTDEQMKDDGTH